MTTTATAPEGRRPLIPFRLEFEKRVEDVPPGFRRRRRWGCGRGLHYQWCDPQHRGAVLRVFRFFYQATFGSWALSDTLVKATPLIMIGWVVPWRSDAARNIGAEGQFYMGAFRQPDVLLPIIRRKALDRRHWGDSDHGHDRRRRRGVPPGTKAL